MGITRFLSWAVLFIVFMCPKAAVGEDHATTKIPTTYGIAAVFAHAYDPEDLDFNMINGFALFDYDRIFPHRAPDALRFKVEGAIGKTQGQDSDFIASAGILALLYLERLKTASFVPYVEAGIGLFYSDHRVEGQEYRLVFNPQAGVGFEVSMKQDWKLFSAFRLHHTSNGGLHKNNRGMNSILVMAGVVF